MTALLLLGLLSVDPPPPPSENEAKLAEKQAESIVRPAVPVPDQPRLEYLRFERTSEWGFTGALGVGARTERGEAGVALWVGWRKWLAANAIVSGLASFQQFDNLTALGLILRVELATRADREQLFPTFSFYVGAGPEVLTNSASTSGGVRLVAGVHLPTIWPLISRGQYPFQISGWELLLLLPTVLEVQYRTGGGVAPSTAVVLAVGL